MAPKVKLLVLGREALTFDELSGTAGVGTSGTAAGGPPEEPGRGDKLRGRATGGGDPGRPACATGERVSGGGSSGARAARSRERGGGSYGGATETGSTGSTKGGTSSKLGAGSAQSAKTAINAVIAASPSGGVTASCCTPLKWSATPFIPSQLIGDDTIWQTRLSGACPTK